MELKPRVVGFSIILVLLLLLLFDIKFNSIEEPTVEVEVEYNHEVNQDGVLKWLDFFLKHDFTSCDKLLENKSYGLHSSDVYSSVIDNSYYDTALTNLVNSIVSIEVTNVEDNKYELLVTYMPYIPISELSNLPDISNMVQMYYNNEIDDLSFKTDLEQKYLDIYSDNCFVSGNEMIQTVLVLSEKKINGVTYVYGTKSFVDSLLSDSNIKHNVSVYESTVKDVVADLIKAN